jgi:cephalosporin-C deacetylase-like acetyl esterase
MDWKTETTLRSYLLQTMHQQYDERRETLASALGTPEGIADYREQCRQKYILLLGAMPVKTPLNAQVTGRIRRIDYDIEKVIYESRPGHHITSNLYLPSGKGPFPAVLIFCGHEMTSKATESYQQTAIVFASNGFAALVVDPVSQGERVQFTDSAGKRILRGSTTEHTLLNAGATLTGSGIVAWELFDNVRSLDYLASRPEVDPDMIGCLGNSGGGAQTTWFIGYDERVKAAAPCSFITSREREYELNGTGDGCQQLPFEGREQLEIADYLLIFAPKPLLILAGKYDFVDYPGTVDAYNELADAYSVLGEPEKIKLFTCEDGHGISWPKQEAAVKWFRKWLCSDTSDIIHDMPVPETENDTWCTPAGQVTAFYGDEVTVQSVNLKNVYDRQGARKQFMNLKSEKEVREKLRQILAIPESSNQISTEYIATREFPGYAMQKLIIRKKGEVPLPCLLFLPDKKAVMDTVVLRLDHRGKSEVIEENTFVGTNISKGHIVVLADLRGMGETAEKPQANDPKYYNIEYHNAILSLHTGQPLPGQRVKDILSLLDFISSDDELKGLPVKVMASGQAAAPALFTAALDKRIAALELSETIASFAEITERPMDRDWFSYVVPGIMNYFDLPDLATLRPDLAVKYTDNKNDRDGK